MPERRIDNSPRKRVVLPRAEREKRHEKALLLLGSTFLSETDISRQTGINRESIRLLKKKFFSDRPNYGMIKKPKPPKANLKRGKAFDPNSKRGRVRAYALQELERLNSLPPEQRSYVSLHPLNVANALGGGVKPVTVSNQYKTWRKKGEGFLLPRTFSGLSGKPRKKSVRRRVIRMENPNSKKGKIRSYVIKEFERLNSLPPEQRSYDPLRQINVAKAIGVTPKDVTNVYNDWRNKKMAFLLPKNFSSLARKASSKKPKPPAEKKPRVRQASAKPVAQPAKPVPSKILEQPAEKFSDVSRQFRKEVLPLISREFSRSSGGLTEADIRLAALKFEGESEQSRMALSLFVSGNLDLEGIARMVRQDVPTVRRNLKSLMLRFIRKYRARQ